VDPRVIVLERTNARHLTLEALGGTKVDFCVVDVSFIGLAKLLPAIAGILKQGGTLLALVKPQFEAGREEVAKGKGVIKDEDVRLAAVARVRESLGDEGFEVLGEVDSELAGPKGNLERFVLARLTLEESGPDAA
jgi:23S rRNA (cytidine1920-2'-O)/16S rRNA (cytidine1409-2'-O)-methyltransferase